MSSEFMFFLFYVFDAISCPRLDFSVGHAGLLTKVTSNSWINNLFSEKTTDNFENSLLPKYGFKSV